MVKLDWIIERGVTAKGSPSLSLPLAGESKGWIKPIGLPTPNGSKERGHMITIKKLLKILQEDLAHKRRFVTTEVYDGEGNRDIFQEGYNYGKDQFLEEVIETINRGGRIGMKTNKPKKRNKKRKSAEEREYEIQRNLRNFIPNVRWW
jgi:hypothetical protein